MIYDNIDRTCPRGRFPICFAFSLHKCGSTLMNKMIMEICDKSSISRMNIPGPLFHSGILARDWSIDPNLTKKIKPGSVYHGFRFLPPVLKKLVLDSSTRSVFLVRDPRDALVSRYFSFKPGGSHIKPKGEVARKEFDRRKKESKVFDYGIDEYVLAVAPQLRKRMADYQCIDFNVNKFFRYEDIFFNKGKFLTDIFDVFEVEVEKGLIEKIAKKNDIVPSKEDASRHVRKGIPGDHVLKLKSETISKLNSFFRDESRFFGYELA